ncbi:MAG: GNAT family N-acetyltransferase [Ardenticatenaceae bacterium]
MIFESFCFLLAESGGNYFYCFFYKFADRYKIRQKERRMSIQIRPIKPEDYEQVLAVARTLASWFNPLDQMALVIDLPRHEGLVATEEAEVLGFVTYHLFRPQVAELSWFGVLPTQQGRGIGRQLLVALETTLAWRGVRTLELSTVPADHDKVFAATNSFYKRHGFTIHKWDNNYYAYGRPRILLKKEIAKSAIQARGKNPQKHAHIPVKEPKSVNSKQ